MMPIVTVERVRDVNLLTLASLPLPTMMRPVTARGFIDSAVVGAVIAASIPNIRRTTRAVPTIDQIPRAARNHIALEES